MAYSKKPNLFKRILFSRGMAIAIIFAIVFVGYGLVSLVGKSLEAAKSRKISEAQAATLKQKEADLSKKLDALATPQGQEAALREQYPVVKPGERVVVITDESAETSDAGALHAKKSFWGFMKGLFN